MELPKLTHREIKEYRERLIRKQRGRCPLCGEPLLPEEAALDHCHKTGHVRRALHRSCNAAEGKILHWAGIRSRGDDPEKFLKNLLKYWKQDYTNNPIHPTHGKKRRRKKRTRKS